MNEITNILSITQLRLNKFKVLYCLSFCQSLRIYCNMCCRILWTESVWQFDKFVENQGYGRWCWRWRNCRNCRKRSNRRRTARQCWGNKCCDWWNSKQTGYVAKNVQRYRQVGCTANENRKRPIFNGASIEANEILFKISHSLALLTSVRVDDQKQYSKSFLALVGDTWKTNLKIKYLACKLKTPTIFVSLRKLIFTLKEF